MIEAIDYSTFKFIKLNLLFNIQIHKTHNIQIQTYLWRRRNVPHKINVPATRIHPRITRLQCIENQSLGKGVRKKKIKFVGYIRALLTYTRETAFRKLRTLEKCIEYD